MASKSPAELVRELQLVQASLTGRVDGLQKEADRDADLREHVAVLEAPLRKLKDESDRRGTQFLFLTVGFLFTLGGNLLVQLLLAYLRK